MICVIICYSQLVTVLIVSLMPIAVLVLPTKLLMATMIITHMTQAMKQSRHALLMLVGRCDATLFLGVHTIAQRRAAPTLVHCAPSVVARPVYAQWLAW